MEEYSEGFSYHFDFRRAKRIRLFRGLDFLFTVFTA